MRSVVRSIAKHAVFSVLGNDPALGLKLSWITRTGALTILNFHRVNNNRLSNYNAMDPRLFDELIGWLLRGFDIVTFGELGETCRTKRPKLILSFDDGYKDFITTVVPILDRHRVRANQNIIPATVDTGMPPLNIILQDFVDQAPESLLRETPLPGFASAADLESCIGNRNITGQRASAALKQMSIVQQKAVMSNLQQSFERLDSWSTTQFMTLEEIKEISQIHEIGAHSIEHASMAAEADEYVANDAYQCRTWFGHSLGLAPRIYALPNGSHRAGHEQIIKAAGFEHVLGVGEQFSRADATIHSRFTMHGRSIAEVRFRATGALVRQ